MSSVWTWYDLVREPRVVPVDPPLHLQRHPDLDQHLSQVPFADVVQRHSVLDADHVHVPAFPGLDAGLLVRQQRPHVDLRISSLYLFKNYT